MDKTKSWLIQQEMNWFYLFNQRPQAIIKFFQFITHLGGAVMTISIPLILLIFGEGSIHETAKLTAFSLASSHLIVSVIKRIVKRIRPYVQLPDAMNHIPPLKDHSFPSGHSTAVFSVATPFMLQFPMISALLLPIASIVAISRIVLGVHYPSDVVCGVCLGVISSIVMFVWI
ncbi:phosphatase PAP2 family protein [Falsibacillus albus]|uniref:Phosphatase PAP2 family protein n=1 Tax=Falsibacillus albus TaxID=2478915 RepID=A0A3L7JSY1_9BACI|nr:phosphatase PAP2 family protein [Falsibacillus albus]RLQ93977.1 phosphatase PAP2 family protein [Falsibacillus albus]